MNTNVLYLTTKCNLKCSYCYENQKDNKTDNSLSYEDIDKFINNLYKQCILNKVPNAMLCLMGGEPLLEFDKITYIYDKTVEFKNNYNFSIFLNIITNGTLFNDKYDEISRIFNYGNPGNVLMISYDGICQYKRTESTIVESTMEELNKRNIPYGISYTITKDNFEKEILLTDLIRLIMHYFSNIIEDRNLNCDRIRRFRVNFNQAELRPLYNDYEKRVAKLKEYCDYIYMKFGVPICYMSCNSCSYCIQDSSSQINYVIPTDSSAKIKTQDRKAVQGFTHFK